MTSLEVKEALLQQLKILESESKDLTFTERCAYAEVLISLHLAECQGSLILSEPQQES